MGKLIKSAVKCYVGICCVLFVTKLILCFFLQKEAKKDRNAYSVAVLGDAEHKDVMKVASYLEVEPLCLTLANDIRKIEGYLHKFGPKALLSKVQAVLVKWMGAV